MKIVSENIPEASKHDKLAIFGGSPRESDNPAIATDELWETMS